MVSGLDWDLGDALDPGFGAVVAAALESDGFEGMRALLREESSWHIAASGVFAGTYTGPDAIVTLLTAIRDRGVGFAPFDTVVSDAHTGLLLTYDREADGHVMRSHGMWLMHVEDDVILECFWFFEDLQGFDALFGSG